MHKIEEKPQSRQDRWRWYRLSVPVLFLGILPFVLMLWTDNIWEKQIQDFFISDAVMDMRGDINAFQIIFEEYKNRDSHADIGKSREILSRASRIIDFLLLGGRRDPGFVIHPLRDKKNRAHAEAIKSMIRELDLLAIQVSTMRAGEPATSLYHRFDEVFKALMTKAGDLEEVVEEDIALNLSYFRRLFWSVLVAWSLAMILATARLLFEEKRRRSAEQAQQESEGRYRSLVDSTEDSIYLVDRNYCYVSMNTKHQKRLGQAADSVLGRPYSDFHSQAETRYFIEKVEKVFTLGASFQDEHRSSRDGRYFLQTLSPVREPDGKISAVTVVSKDITSRKLMEEELRTLSLTDELTGLYNRRGFFALAEQQLKIANRLKRGLFMLYADLDGLKAINDTFGHLEGDLMLIEVAHVLKESFREADIIARIGGDEFVVLQVAVADVSMEPIASRLRQNLEIKNSSINRNFSLSLSIGIVRYDPDSPCTLDELLSQADKMMYQQKKNRADSPQ